MAREEEVLDGIPGMGVAFAKALVPSRESVARIPSKVAVVPHVTQDIDRLAAYNRVCGYTLRNAVPPTWLHVLTFPLHVHLLGDRESSVRLVGAVHVSNTMTLHRPVSVQEELELRVYVDNLRPHKRGALIDLVGSVRVEGETVWTGTSTYLASGMVAEGIAEQRAHEPFTTVTPQAMWTLPPDLGRRYRAVAHDPNPIHTSRIAAKAFGFARPVIHGMWGHARALSMLEGRLSQTYTASVAFVRPILLPSKVGFAAAPTSEGFDTAVTTRDGAKPHLLMSVTGAP